MKLIIVHSYDNNKEIMINIDKIVAIKNDSDTEKGYIGITDNYFIHTKESMYEIWTLISKANQRD